MELEKKKKILNAQAVIRPEDVSHGAQNSSRATTNQARSIGGQQQFFF